MADRPMGGRDPEIEAARVLEEVRSREARRLAKARKALVRRVDAIQKDLARADHARARAEDATWFVAEAARAPRGLHELVVIDPCSEPTHLRTFALDPSKTAREQVESVFALSRRLQRGKPMAEERLSRTLAQVADLDRQIEAVRTAASIEAIDLLTTTGAKEPLDAALQRPFRAPKGARRVARLPYRVFRCGAGTPIYVGRGAADNDALTFRVARPRDLWLHAKGTSGAHVVLPLATGKDPDATALVDAAHLATHFSSLRGELTVEVTYARRGRVRKPRGSGPGLVVVDQGQTLLLRVEPHRLKRLLESEVKPDG